MKMQGSITTPGSIALAQAQAQAQVPAKAPLAGQVSTIVTTSTTTTVAKTITITRPTGVSFKKDVPVSVVSLCPSQRGRSVQLLLWTEHIQTKSVLCTTDFQTVILVLDLKHITF